MNRRKKDDIEALRCTNILLLELIAGNTITVLDSQGRGLELTKESSKTRLLLTEFLFSVKELHEPRD